VWRVRKGGERERERERERVGRRGIMRGKGGEGWDEHENVIKHHIITSHSLILA
jgi:hypothetical protein